MSRHLISATLTDDAYDCYSHWVKERKGSEMISKVIVESFQDITAAEQIVKWRKNRLPHLVCKAIQYIPKDDWFKISEEDRVLIWGLARPSRQYSIPIMSWDTRMPGEPWPTDELGREEE